MGFRSRHRRRISARIHFISAMRSSFRSRRSGMSRDRLRFMFAKRSCFRSRRPGMNRVRFLLISTMRTCFRSRRSGIKFVRFLCTAFTKSRFRIMIYRYRWYTFIDLIGPILIDTHKVNIRNFQNVSFLQSKLLLPMKLVSRLLPGRWLCWRILMPVPVLTASMLAGFSSYPSG